SHERTSAFPPRRGRRLAAIAAAAVATQAWPAAPARRSRRPAPRRRHRVVLLRRGAVVRLAGLHRGVLDHAEYAGRGLLSIRGGDVRRALRRVPGVEAAPAG